MPQRAKVSRVWPLEERDLLRPAERQRMRAAVEAAGRRTGLARRAGVDRADSRSGQPASSTSTSGSSQSMPREPVRTISTSSPRAAPRRDRRGDRVGADRRRRPHRAGRRSGSCARARAISSSSRAASSRADRLAVEHRRRRAGAQAEAIDGLEGQRPRGVVLAAGDAELLAHARPAPRSPSTGRPRRGRASARAARPAAWRKS